MSRLGLSNQLYIAALDSNFGCWLLPYIFTHALILQRTYFLICFDCRINALACTFIVIYDNLLFIKNISRGLIGLELSVKSSYPPGSCPNLELWLHRGILNTNIRHFDVISSYILRKYCNMIWRHANLCGLCQSRKTASAFMFLRTMRVIPECKIFSINNKPQPQ